jgi:predicted nucleic acid-binding protein
VTIGVDSSLIVAAVHANHPRHAVAAGWLVRSIGKHQLVAAQHAVLEAYAVLTRLPGELRVTPSEARDLLTGTVKANMPVAEQPEGIWGILDKLVDASVVGGRSYDALILLALQAFGVEALATLNPSHFRDLAPGLRIIDPSVSQD